MKLIDSAWLRALEEENRNAGEIEAIRLIAIDFLLDQIHPASTDISDPIEAAQWLLERSAVSSFYGFQKMTIQELEQVWELLVGGAPLYVS